MNTFFGPVALAQRKLQPAHTTIPQKWKLSTISTEHLLRPVPEALRKPVGAYYAAWAKELQPKRMVLAAAA
jgi:hypothetical protein